MTHANQLPRLAATLVLEFHAERRTGPHLRNGLWQVSRGRSGSSISLSGADYLPTLCALTGVTIDSNKFEGEDTSAAWLGKKEHVRTKPLLWKTSAPGSDAGIREAQWKLITPTRKNGTKLALYHIINDPTEKQDLASKHPDIVQTLSKKIKDWTSTLPKEYIKTDDKD
jgi:arylsulfatase A-like enzyme